MNVGSKHFYLHFQLGTPAVEMAPFESAGEGFPAVGMAGYDRPLTCSDRKYRWEKLLAIKSGLQKGFQRAKIRLEAAAFYSAANGPF
jgi:hypothetical protein